MARKDRPPLAALSVALSGIDSCLAIMEQVNDGKKRKELIERAKAHSQEAQDALVKINFHLDHL